jgi:dimethylhistidine N-methyltransferase
MNDILTSDQLEIVKGLMQAPASISPKYFYDAKGSSLFEDITRLQAYYPTRTELAIMTTHAPEIARRVGANCTLIELGAGNCQKAKALCELINPAHFVAVDISEEFLDDAVAGMRLTFPDIEIQAIAADLTADIVLPASLPAERRLVFYPGSSIGNFDPPQALALLSRIGRLIEDDGALLIGVDLVKDEAVLNAAYDDDAGVTAAFNVNVLSHVNGLIDSDFDVKQWQHRAFFNAEQSRIEMHLEAKTEHLVRWRNGCRSFAQGERIHTENSYKYRVEDFVALLNRAGFSQTRVWTDEQAWFAVVLGRPKSN